MTRQDLIQRHLGELVRGCDIRDILPPKAATLHVGEAMLNDVPDCHRIYSTAVIMNPFSPSRRSMLQALIEEDDTTSRIDIWNTDSLTLRHRFYTTLFEKKIPSFQYKNRMDQLLEVLVLIDDDYLLAALLDGRIVLFECASGRIVLDEKIGGAVVSASATRDKLAVSNFPGLDHDSYACGVKIFDIRTLIEHKWLEQVDALEPTRLEILPNSISFTSDGEHLLLRGSAFHGEGFVNTIELVDLATHQGTLLYKEYDTHQSHKIPYCPPADSIPMLARNRVIWYRGPDRTSLVINRDEHPAVDEFFSDKPVQDWGAVTVSADGEHAVVYKMNSAQHIFLNRTRLAEADDGIQAVWPSLHRFRHIYFHDPDHVIGMSLLGDSYKLCMADVPHYSEFTTSRHHGAVLPIYKNAYDCLPDGSLAIGCIDERVHCFGRTLTHKQSLPSVHGVVDYLRYNTHDGRCYCVTEPGAALRFAWGDTQMAVHLSVHDGMPFLPGPKQRASVSIQIPIQPKGSNSHFFADLGRRLFFSNERWVSAGLKSKPEISIRQTPDIPGNDDRVLLSRKIPDYIVGILDHDGTALLVDKNASVYIVRGILDSPDISQASLVDKRDAAAQRDMPLQALQGAVKTSTGTIYIWTASALLEATMQGADCIAVRRSVALSGIRQIRHDPARNRLVIAFMRHLGFYSTDMVELYRLYLLEDQTQLIHVPYPEEFLTPGDRHLGFWKATGAIPEGFQLLDASGQALDDPARLETAIDEAFGKTWMVDLALDDYDEFLDRLRLNSFTQQNARALKTQRLLVGFKSDS